MEISLHTLIPLFMPGSVYSGSASWDDRGQVFPDKLCGARFRIVPTLCLNSGIVGPLWLCLGQGVCALLAEWPGYFTCCCSNMGVEWTRNKSQCTNLTLEKKIPLPLLPGLKVAAFWIRVWRCYQQAVLAPYYWWWKNAVHYLCSILQLVWTFLW